MADSGVGSVSGRSHRVGRLEMKYLVLTVVCASVLLVLLGSDALDGVRGQLERFVGWVANEEGLVGGSVALFLLAMVANSTLLIQVPYTLPMAAIVISSDGVAKVAVLSVATAVGAGIGELNSYLIARSLPLPAELANTSRVLRWIRRAGEDHPRRMPLLVLLTAGTSLPDDVVIWPLAIARYPVRNMLAPIFVGKLVYCVAIGFIAYYGTELVDVEDATVGLDFTIVLLVGFLLYAFYLFEKGRQGGHSTEGGEDD
jgi:membrane protein YqaA with SNARE-associated domain